MRTVATGIVGLLLAAATAAAQTPSERAAILRDFQRSVAAWHEPAPHPPIFTPPVAMVFRQLIATALAKADTATALRGAGMPAHRARALDAVPAETGTVAPVLARALPALPDGFEYRLVDNDLVLLDAPAAVVVDVLRNAVGVTALKED